jgi:hypothetical protein
MKVELTLEPTSSWITGKLRWILISLLVLGIGPWSLLLSNMTGLLPQRWHRPSHIIGTARNVEASQCLGRIAQVKTNPVTQACIDSGATSDMDPRRQVFTDYIKLTNCYVLVAKNVKILCLGRGSVSITLSDIPLLLRNVLHVPNHDMPLLSCRVLADAARAAASSPAPKAAFLPFPLSSSRSTTPTSVPFHAESAQATAPMTTRTLLTHAEAGTHSIRPILPPNASLERSSASLPKSAVA